MNRRAWHLTFGALLLWGAAWATVSAGYPRLYSPYSVSVVIPLLAVYWMPGGKYAVLTTATFPIPALFVVWSWPLLRGWERIPRRTKVAAIVLVSLSFCFLVLGWRLGVKYQGAFHTTAMGVFNAAFWAVLLLLYRTNARTPSYVSNFLFHWVLFGWLAWVGFPWLGELI